MADFLQTSAIKESILTILVVTALSLMCIYFPSLMLVIQLFWMVPLIIVVVRQGLAVGLLTTGLIGLLLLFLVGPAQAVILLLQFAGGAFVFGLASRKQLNPEMSLLMGVGVTIFSFVLLALFLIYVLGFAPDYFAQNLQGSIDPLLEKYRAEGIFNNNYPNLSEEAVREQLEAAVAVINRLFPALLIIWGGLLAIANFLLARRALKGLGIETPRFLPLKEWFLPWWIVWGFIGGYGAYLLGDYYKLAALSAIGENIVLLYMPVLFVLGCAVLSFYLGKYFTSRNSRWFILCILLILFGLLFVPIIAGVGLLDLLFNYRHQTRHS